MVKPFPCIFDAALDLMARSVPPSFPSLGLPLPGRSRLDLFALVFLPVWALVNT